MADYTITFMPLRATGVQPHPYVLSIGSGSGNVPLKGGEQPFTTQESDDEDMFTPIRTQTGYFRIVDDGRDANGNAFDWKSLIPATDTAMPVTLTRGCTVVWRGFMQAQDFGSVLYGNPQEREFPVQCVLSVLGGTDINYTQTAIQNFAYLLKQIVDAIPSAQRPTEFYIQGGANAQEWLLKRIDWQNFVSEDADGLTARFTMYQCLEDMCRFWGWTARTKGTTMYLTCADDAAQTTWLKLTYQELGQLAAYTSGTIPGDTSDTFETASLSGDIFASTNNDEYVQRGYKKATVQVDGNCPGDTVMEAYPESVLKTMNTNGTYTEQYSDCYAVYSQNLYTFSSSFLTGNCPDTSKAAFCLMRVKKDINDAGQDYSVIRIAGAFVDYATPLASFETVYHHSYYDNTIPNGGFDYGGILIKFDIFRKGKRYEDYDGGGVGKKSMYIRVGIGIDRQHALWYNGNSWSSSVTALSVRVGSKIQRNLEINTNHVDLTGKLFVDFMGSSDMPEGTGGGRPFEVEGFSVEFKRRTYSFGFNKQEGVSSQEYVSKNNNKTDNEFMTDCIYASGNNMLFGYGVVLETDGKWMGQLTYGSTQKWAEQHLADRVTNFWQTSRRRLAVELRQDLIADITPRHKVTIDGMTGYPIAISHEWRDDVTQLTILQL